MNTSHKQDKVWQVAVAAVLLGCALWVGLAIGRGRGKGVVVPLVSETGQTKAGENASKHLEPDKKPGRRDLVRQEPEGDGTESKVSRSEQPRRKSRWTQEFLILTETSQPIEGARVLTHRGKSKASDVEGRTRLQVLAGEKLLVLAAAFDPRWIRIPVQPLDLQRVTLGSPTGLEVRVTSPRPPPEDALWIELETYESLYPVQLLQARGITQAPSPQEMVSSLSTTGSQTGAENQASTHEPAWDDASNDGFFSLPGTGRLFWTGVFPRRDPRLGKQEARIQVSLRDQYGASLGSQAVTLVPGKTQEIHFPLLKSARLLTAWVLSPEGLPVRGARVEIGTGLSGESPGAAATVKRDGSFRIGPFFGDIPSVFIMAKGYVQQNVSSTQLRTSPRIRLERSRSLRLELLDATGHKVQARIVLHSPTMTFGAKTTSPGLFLFEDVARGPLVAHITVGGETRKHPIPARLTRYRLRW